MLRASSLMAVAMRAWSIAPKPRARAVSRATMRAATISRSLLIMMTLGSAIGSVLRNSAQRRDAFFQVKRRQYLRKFKPELNQRDRDGRLQARDHDFRAH